MVVLFAENDILEHVMNDLRRDFDEEYLAGDLNALEAMRSRWEQGDQIRRQHLLCDSWRKWLATLQVLGNAGRQALRGYFIIRTDRAMEQLKQ